DRGHARGRAARDEASAAGRARAFARAAPDDRGCAVSDVRRAHREYTPEQLRARMLARSRVAAMRSRARRIRGSVVGLTAALFTAVFLAVYVQLASGHDPALSAAGKRSTSATTG